MCTKFFANLFRNKVLVALLILLGAAACDLPWAAPSVEEAPPPAPAAEVAASAALVTFYVEVPADTPPGEPILLRVLDEVTGLALNAQRFSMTAIDATHYVIGLPLPAGTTVKYRYSRQGDILAEEHTSDGRAVRYRLYHVAAPGEVHDVVTRWNDTRCTGVSGRIAGTATDAASGEPVPGLLVTAGGAQVITAGEGSFLIEGLPPGTHNLVVYALDGSYLTYQQGALVAAESTTPAPIKLDAAARVDITFILHVPEDTPPSVPVLMAGNLYQLGNTFADLSGGISTLATRMPVLAPLPDGSYGIILSLPAGADLRYKYTFGDGFWNAEHAASGEFVVRQMIVPDAPTVIEDRVETWHAGYAAPITFDITVPANTPPGENIFIHLNPYGWTEPLPMWHLGGDRWAYILYSPLDMVNQIGYRYCRAGQCGHTDDARTPGDFTSGQIVPTSTDPLGLPDKVEAWAWLETDLPGLQNLEGLGAKLRGPEFVAGVEFQEMYHPSWIPRLPAALDEIDSLAANWVILTPSWTFTRLDPPVCEPVTGQDPLWLETAATIRQAQRRDLHVALRPVPHFPTAVNEWWSSSPRDFPWWVSWFDRYQAFVLHYADLAEQNGVQTLILGGEWMSPALPSGSLANGDPSGVPPDAEERYRELLAEVREHFSGTLAWSLSYPADVLNPPGFLDEIDQIYVLWSAPLAATPDASPADLQAEAERIISTDIYGMWLIWKQQSGNESVIISLAYPSAEGILTGCLADPIVECIPPESLKYPAPDYPLLELGLEDQARAYNAVMAAVSQHEWVGGVVSRGYYPPAVLHDKSTSVHGKPAEEVLHAWFEEFR